MSAEKQILEWQEELKNHKERLQQAEAVVKQETELISMIQGGIQFGEMLMKKNESLNQQSDKEALEKQSNKMSSKSEV
tara:strand:+ start:614 stop:847 length:234 start_codon:yes stop_codon:yes gene_type:complete